MNLRRYIRNTVALLALSFGLCLVSCEEHYLKYDASYSGVYFTKDSTAYSFGVTPADQKSYTYKIPFAIMGGTSQNKRNVNYEICSHLTTAEEGKHYTIEEVCIMPDSVTGYIPITIYRDELDGTYATGYTRYELCLKLVPNEHFVPTLDSLHQVHTFRFDNAVERPEWYNNSGEKIWPKEKLGEWHPLKLIKMVEFFHEIKDIKPETYKKMVLEYGENLEHIKNGDPELYKTTFDKYIYAPMYEFFTNPDNKDYIIFELGFSDFDFDEPFPNPYAGK